MSRIWWNPRSGVLHLADHARDVITRCGRWTRDLTRWTGRTDMGNPRCYTCWKEQTDG